MTTKKILVDAHVEVDMNIGWQPRYPEDYAEKLEEACKDFMYFLRDHRSLDINDAYVVREYAYRCEHCGWTYEADTKTPDCCEDAIREWATTEQIVAFGYEP